MASFAVMTEGSTPDITVVVAARDAASHVESAVWSALAQAGVVVECVGVDDGSTDSTGKLLTEMESERTGLRVLRRGSPGGAGHARNDGIVTARGRWIGFLDADDRLRPNVLGDLVQFGDRVAADVVIFDYAIEHADGRSESNQRSHVLRALDGEVVDAPSNPELLTIMPAAWNKLYRRSWLLDRSLRFPTGIYEDVPFTYEALWTASAIGVSGHVGLDYCRRHDAPSALRADGARHLDILDQWDRVAALWERTGDEEMWRCLFDRILAHAVYVFDTRVSALDEDIQREYFKGLSDRCRRDRPPGWAAGARGARERAIAAGKFVPFRLAVRAISGTRRPRRMLRDRQLYSGRLAGRVRREARSARYQFEILRSPVDDRRAVFSSYWDVVPSCNPLAISRQLAAAAPDIEQVWIVRRADIGVPDYARKVVVGSEACERALASARWFVSNVNFPDHLEKRPGQVHVQTHHGTPLKTMGVDLAAYPLAAGLMSFDRLLRRSSRWDYVVSGNPHSTAIWRQAYPVDFRTLETGAPRNDVLADPPVGLRDALRGALGIRQGSTAVLYAPTLRDYVVGPEPRIDFGRLAAGLSDLDITFLVRGHYSQPVRPPSGAQIIDVSSHPDASAVCLASDLLITDYSSVMFDYAVLSRPIVLYIDDWPEYRWARGTYLDPAGIAPGPVARTHDELRSTLQTMLQEPWVGGSRYDAFRQRFCPWDDGQASARVIADVFMA